ncbi:MAG: Fe(3+) ABC transporter substrate-binding protein, partial [Rhodospirillales bacterium]|nr:Fe(3+) ABC transporter substrate-binding protein [Rhodospirillales bacterium]
IAGEHKGEVNIYNSRHYTTDTKLWDGFTEATGIKVNVINAGHDELIQRIIQEGENSPADLLITVDAGRLVFASDKDLFVPVKSKLLEETIPSYLRDPDGKWFGLAYRARVLVYHKDRIKPGELSTYEGLADPSLKGRLLVRSGTNIYNLSLMGAIIEVDGVEGAEAWGKGIVANMARPPQGGDTDQLKALAAGAGDVALSNHYYFARLAASEKPEDRAVVEDLRVFFPSLADRGTHVNVSGAGVIRTGKNRENAIKMLEYLVTPEAQDYFANVNYEFPVNAEVPPNPVLASWGPFKQDRLNPSVYAANSAEAAKIMDRVGWK